MIRVLSLLAIGAATSFGQAAAPPSQATTPFSHKLHLTQLKVKLECASCHPNAATSIRPQDNLLPDEKTCLGSCHSAIEIAGPPTTRVVHFSHQQHAKMGNLAPVIAAAIDKGNYLQPPGDTRQ